MNGLKHHFIEDAFLNQLSLDATNTRSSRMKFWLYVNFYVHIQILKSVGLNHGPASAGQALSLSLKSVGLHEDQHMNRSIFQNMFFLICPWG